MLLLGLSTVFLVGIGVYFYSSGSLPLFGGGRNNNQNSALVNPVVGSFPETKTITEEEANRVIDRKLEGKQYSLYTLNTAGVVFNENELTARVNYNNNKELLITAALTEDGTGFKVSEIDSVGFTVVPKLEIEAIRLLIDNAEAVIYTLIPEYAQYKSRLDRVTISNKQVDVYLNSGVE